MMVLKSIYLIKISITLSKIYLFKIYLSKFYRFLGLLDVCTCCSANFSSLFFWSTVILCSSFSCTYFSLCSRVILVLVEVHITMLVYTFIQRVLLNITISRRFVQANGRLKTYNFSLSRSFSLFSRSNDLTGVARGSFSDTLSVMDFASSFIIRDLRYPFSSAPILIKLRNSYWNNQTHEMSVQQKSDSRKSKYDVEHLCEGLHLF